MAKRMLFVTGITVIALFLSSATGCTSTQVTLIPAVDELIELSPGDLTDVNSRLARDAEAIRSFQVMSDATVHEGYKSTKFRQVIVFERPDNLRVELFSVGLQRLLALFMVHDGTIVAVDKEAKKAYKGKASIDNLSKLLAIPLQPERLMLLFCGRFKPLRDDELKEARLFHDPAAKRHVLELLLDDNRVFHLLVRFEGTVSKHAFQSREMTPPLRLEAFEVKDGLRGKVIFAAQLYYHDGREGLGVVPSRIAMFLPEKEVRVEFTYRNPRVNPDLSKRREALFQIPSPLGVPVVELD